MNFLIAFIYPTCIFLLGLFGLVQSRKNILLVIISIELLLLSINIFLLLTSSYLDDTLGEILSIFILTVASAESSIGLAILISFYRLKGTIAMSTINLLKG
jgi:NADH-quinone oxidoreductase subunit K